MRLILAIAAAGFVSAGIAHAQEPQDFRPVLIGAAQSALGCVYQTELAPLDVNWEATSEWTPTNQGADSLRKIAERDEGYLRAMELLEGTISVDPRTGLRHIEAVATGELPRFWLIFKIRELWFSITERFMGGKWIPTSFQTNVRVDVGVGFLSKEVRRGYRVKSFECDMP